jgi:hypothetical protein
MALAMRLLSAPGAVHWHWSCALRLRAGNRKNTVASTIPYERFAKRNFSSAGNASGRYNLATASGQINLAISR